MQCVDAREQFAEGEGAWSSSRRPPLRSPPYTVVDLRKRRSKFRIGVRLPALAQYFDDGETVDLARQPFRSMMITS